MPDFGRWTSNGGDPSLNEINRSEKFIEALSLERQVYATDREEAELAVLLAGWRDDARRAPMSGIATPREAVTALNKATAQGRVRMPMALVGSMAAAVLCIGGFGAAVYGSGPGDALYGVRGMVFGTQQPVTRDVGVELASSELKQVQQLIDDGQWEEAQQKLQTITTTVATVGDEERKQQLVDQWQQLSVKVENRDPNATVPPDAPPVVLPEVTVTTTPSSPSESPSGESPTSTPVTTETTTPTESTPGSETSPPSEAPTTTAPSATSSTAAPSPSPSTSAEPTTSAPAPTPSSSPATPSSATHTSSAPTTSAAPAVEQPPATTTAAPAVEPTSVPAPARTTAAPPATDGSGSGNGSGNGGNSGGHENQSGGNSGEGPAVPAVELPLLPGLGGGQR